MAELIWNINGKYFKDFGVYVSDSKGIMDEPNQKKADTYDWAEYHGLATNLQSKPKYEAREFELSCWVKGADWLEMRNNFDAIMAEFRKAGKQRLTLDIFGEKTYVWDVNINGKVELKKTLQKGVQVGVFTIKLIEYNPIKKILTTTNSNLQLSFNSPKWVEVNIDGAIESHKGVVNINKTLPNRSLTQYNFSGRNLVRESDFGKYGSGRFGNNGGYITESNEGLVMRLNADAQGIYLFDSFIKKNTQYTVSIWTKAINGTPRITLGFDPAENKRGISLPTSTTEFKRTTVVVTTSYDVQSLIVFNFGSNVSNFILSKIKVDEGNKATDWTPAPEDVHFISIAGNIDEITNLTTNAEVLWERL